MVQNKACLSTILHGSRLFSSLRQPRAARVPRRLCSAHLASDGANPRTVRRTVVQRRQRQDHGCKAGVDGMCVEDETVFFLQAKNDLASRGCQDSCWVRGSQRLSSRPASCTPQDAAQWNSRCGGHVGKVLCGQGNGTGDGTYQNTISNRWDHMYRIAV